MNKTDLTYCGYQVLEFDQADYHEFEYGAFDGDDLYTVRTFIDNHNKLWFVGDDIWTVIHYNIDNSCATKYTRYVVSKNEVAYTYWMDERLFLVSSFGLVDLCHSKKAKSLQMVALDGLNKYIANVVYSNIKTQVNKHLLKEDEGEVIDITPCNTKADDNFSQNEAEAFVQWVKQCPVDFIEFMYAQINENASLKKQVQELQAQLDAVRCALN